MANNEEFIAKIRANNDEIIAKIMARLSPKELIAKIRATLFESAYVLFNDPEDSTRAEETLMKLFTLFGIDEDTVGFDEEGNAIDPEKPENVYWEEDNRCLCWME
jgi:hypothetical protein